MAAGSTSWTISSNKLVGIGARTGNNVISEEEEQLGGVLAMAAGCQREGINTSAQKEGLDSKHPAKETNLNEMRPRILLLPSVLEELVLNP